MGVSYEERSFGELKRGDRFAVGRHEFRRGPGDNIKVDPARLCNPENSLTNSQWDPFNVICLSDGRVRTFRDEEKVLVLRAQDGEET